MMSAGIDIGGTKIEMRVFDPCMQQVETVRLDTPRGGYPELISVITDQIAKTDQRYEEICIGLSIAAAIDPDMGSANASNLPMSGQPFLSDLSRSAGRPLSILHDGAAFALSEANGGSAEHARSCVGIVIGTGVGAGYCIGAECAFRAKGLSVEIGHASIPSWQMTDLRLPDRICGCGRTNCFETYVSGTGIETLSKAVANLRLTGPELSNAILSQDPKALVVYDAWLGLFRELINVIQLTLAPEVIVLGGSVSLLPDVCNRLMSIKQNDIISSLAPPI